jgi:quinol monooxygenase YgiN
MIKEALFVRLNAQPGKEKELEKFLKDGLELVNREPGTNTWFAIRFSQESFAIFDTFPDKAGQDAHLTGEVAKALFGKAKDLLLAPPSVEKATVIAAKVPELEHHE